MGDIFDPAIEEDLFSGFLESQQAACQVIATRAQDVASRRSPDDFKKWFSQQQKKLFEYIKSTKDEPRINGGLMAIDALIDVAAREDRVQLKLFANAITHVSCYYRFSEENVLLAARIIAHLLAAADNLLATFVEHEARRALEYLADDREQQCHFAATVMLTELARNAPNFMSHLKGGSQELVRVIVATYSSKKLHIRLHAIQLLSECLPLMRHDADDPSTQTAHQQIYANCSDVLRGARGSEAAVHGSLLAMKQLLLHRTIQNGFDAVCGLVLRHKDSRHQIVREAVLGIMPVLARADPEKFVEARAGRGMRRGQNGEMRVTGSGDSLAGQGQSAFADAAFRGDDSKMPWLQQCMKQLLQKALKGAEKAAAFLAIADLVSVPEVQRQMAKELRPAELRRHLEKALTPPTSSSDKDKWVPIRDAALHCIGTLCQELGEQASGLVLDLMDAMFRTGGSSESSLIQPLFDTLVTIEYSSQDRPLRAQFKQRLISEVSGLLQVPDLVDGVMVSAGGSRSDTPGLGGSSNAPSRSRRNTGSSTSFAIKRSQSISLLHQHGLGTGSPIQKAVRRAVALAPGQIGSHAKSGASRPGLSSIMGLGYLGQAAQTDEQVLTTVFRALPKFRLNEDVLLPLVMATARYLDADSDAVRLEATKVCCNLLFHDSPHYQQQRRRTAVLARAASTIGVTAGNASTTSSSTARTRRARSRGRGLGLGRDDFESGGRSGRIGGFDDDTNIDDDDDDNDDGLSGYVRVRGNGIASQNSTGTLSALGKSRASSSSMTGAQIGALLGSGKLGLGAHPHLLPLHVRAEGVLEALLNLGISDYRHEVRRTVFKCLLPVAEQALAEESRLRYLIFALNDEQFDVQRTVLQIVGKLVHCNPELVVPTLRTKLVQLLTKMECFRNTDIFREQEEALRLLICLVRIVPSASHEYATTIVGVLVPQLEELISLLFAVPMHSASGGINIGMPRASGHGSHQHQYLGTSSHGRQAELAATFTLCLEAFGAITNVAPPQLVEPYVDMVLEAVVLVLGHKWCPVRARITALNVLASVVRCTGCVMTPYYQYPSLVRLLVKIMRQEVDFNTGSSSGRFGKNGVGVADGSSARPSGVGVNGAGTNSMASLGSTDSYGSNGGSHGSSMALGRGMVGASASNNVSASSSSAQPTAIRTTRGSGRGGELWRLKRAAFRAFGALGAVDLSALRLSGRQSDRAGSGASAMIDDRSGFRGVGGRNTGIPPLVAVDGRGGSVAGVGARHVRLLSRGSDMHARGVGQVSALGVRVGPTQGVGAGGGTGVELELPRSGVLDPELYGDPGYYPAVAIFAMMRILQDPGLVLQHDLALQAIKSILNILDRVMVKGLLALLVPGFTAAIANYSFAGARGMDASKRKFCLQVLAQLRLVVSLADAMLTAPLPQGNDATSIRSILRLGQEARADDQGSATPASTSTGKKAKGNGDSPSSRSKSSSGDAVTYLELLVDLICSFLRQGGHRSDAGILEALLHLLQVVSVSVGDALVPYMPRVIPSLTEMLSGRMPADSERDDPELRVMGRCLDTVCVLGPSLLSHMHLVMSPLMKLVERASMRKRIRLHALDTLYYLMDSIDVSPYLGTVLHVLLHACHSEAAEMAPWLTDARSGDEAFATLGGNEPALLWPTAIAVLQKLKQYCNTEQNSATHALGASINHTIEKIQLLVYHATGWGDGRRNDGIIRSVQRLSTMATVWRRELEENGQRKSGGSYSGRGGGEGDLFDAKYIDERRLLGVWKQDVQSITASASSTREWQRWTRRLSLELLQQSPSRALQKCHVLAQVHDPLARALFFPAFVSCWSVLSKDALVSMVGHLDVLIERQGSLPSEVLQMLLWLCQFMYQESIYNTYSSLAILKSKNLSLRAIATLAEECHSYPQALWCREKELRTAVSGLTDETTQCIDSLIVLNQKLGLKQAAFGVLSMARKKYPQLHAMEQRKKWFEELEQWDKALESYEKEVGVSRGGSPDESTARGNKDNTIPETDALTSALCRIRCLFHLSEWEELGKLSMSIWPRLGRHQREAVAPMLVKAAVDQQDWETAAAYENFARPGLEMQLFNLCWLVVKGKASGKGNTGPHLNIDLIRSKLSDAWKTLNASLTPVLKESYASAFEQLSAVQALGEFEEIITFFELLSSGQHVDARQYRERMYGMWRRRMNGCYQSIKIWQQMMSIRSLAWSRSEEVYSRLKFAALCRKKGETALSLKVLKGLHVNLNESVNSLLMTALTSGTIPTCSADDLLPAHAARGAVGGTGTHAVRLPVELDFQVKCGYYKHLWLTATGAEQRTQKLMAVERLAAVADVLDAAGWDQYGYNGQILFTQQPQYQRGSLRKQSQHLKHPPNHMLRVRHGRSGFEDIGLDDGIDLARRKARGQLRWTVHLRLSRWMLDLHEGSYTDETIRRILTGFDVATQLQPNSAKAWHCLSLAEFRLVNHFRDRGENAKAAARVTSAVQALFLSLVLSSEDRRNSSSLRTAKARGDSADSSSSKRRGSTGGADGNRSTSASSPSSGSAASTSNSSPSISSATKTGTTSGNSHNSRDTDVTRRLSATADYDSVGASNTESGVLIQASVMRLLSLLFDYGHLPQVNAAFAEGMDRIGTDVWIRVIPQLIARIDIGSANVRTLLKQLLKRIVQEQPSMVLSDLSVAAKSGSELRQSIARDLLEDMRREYPALIAQETMVIEELIRIAVTWEEAWRVGLDEASQALFIDNNPEIMVAILKQLHELIAEPPATPSERVFIQAYGATLTAAEGHLRRYIELRDTYKQQLRLYRSTEPSGSGNNIRRSNSRGGGASVATSEHEQGSKDGSQSPRKRGQGRPLPEFQMDLATRSMWELYLKVFRPINKSMTKTKNGMQISLPYVSPRLYAARGLMVPIMGQELIQNAHSNYAHRGGRRAQSRSAHGGWGHSTAPGIDGLHDDSFVGDNGSSYVTIHSMDEDITLMASKQRPRRIAFWGNDGKKYTFLLKGHEDLRQDERVMQLFGLVNELLAKHQTSSSGSDIDGAESTSDGSLDGGMGGLGQVSLSITRYPVVPLSVNTGIVGWVHHTDTLHALIKAHRKARDVPLNVEYNLLTRMAPPSKDSYAKLSPLQQLEIFEMIMEKTSGMDLARVMHEHSQSNWQEWLARRSTFTRSLAVMSMVGYLLGLGDRHPSNLMIHRNSGKVVHIDFGDCWEVTQTRKKFPEKVPFRFTRMLENAMEIAGRDGIFRSTAETVMRVLREHRMSAEAMLGAFVHDPLINWRLVADGQNNAGVAGDDGDGGPSSSSAQGGGATIAGAAPMGTKGVSQAGGGSMGGAGGKGASDNPLQRSTEAAVQNTGAMPVGSVVTGPGTGSVLMRGSLLAGGGTNKADVAGVKSKAAESMHRVTDKLNGRDYGVFATPAETGPPMAVKEQVDWLIEQATAHENLCQNYVGWCPFW